MSVTTFSFGEWLPDQPELGGNHLVRAENVIHSDGGYSPYRTFTITGQTVGSAVINAGFSALSDAGVQFLFAQSGSSFLSAVNNGQNWTARGNPTAGVVTFTQFDNLVIASGEASTAQAYTINSASSFSTLATSGTSPPPAGAVGVVNRFVVVGDLNGSPVYPHGLQWSAIDDPRNWPVPNSATAIATQAGFQLLSQAYGEVNGIHGGDQFGIILQDGAVTRMTYVGPPVVFQFDVIDNIHGSVFKQGSIKVGSIVYFVSSQGFFKTDGVSVVPIGDGKVDRFFWDSYSGNSFATNCWGYDSIRNTLYFGFSITASADLDSILAYDIESGRWTYCNEPDGFRQFITGSQGGPYAEDLYGFSVATQKSCGTFAGLPGEATIETCDSQLNPPGRAYVYGIKPNVESTGTAPSITVNAGYRNSLGDSISYTTNTAPTARTGMADMRADAKYHRARIQITGNFEKTSSFEFLAQPSGEA